MLIGEPTTSVEIYNEAKESESLGIHTMPILKVCSFFKTFIEIELRQSNSIYHENYLTK